MGASRAGLGFFLVASLFVCSVWGQGPVTPPVTAPPAAAASEYIWPQKSSGSMLRKFLLLSLTLLSVVSTVSELYGRVLICVCFRLGQVGRGA